MASLPCMGMDWVWGASNWARLQHPMALVQNGLGLVSAPAEPYESCAWAWTRSGWAVTPNIRTGLGVGQHCSCEDSRWTKSTTCYKDSPMYATSATGRRHVNQWTWKDFLIRGVARSTEFQNYQNYVGRTLRTCATLGPWVDTGWSFPIPRYWGGWEAGYDFSPYLSSSPRNRKKKKKIWKHNHTHFSLALDPFHPDQLHKHFLK